MRVTKEHIDQALKILGIYNDFIRMNQGAASFADLSSRFETFKGLAKKRYLNEAKKLHPDRQAGDAEKMKTLNAAYDLFKKVRLEQPQPQPMIRINFVPNIYGHTTTGTSTAYWPGTGGF
jgi:hypothetical protein